MFRAFALGVALSSILLVMGCVAGPAVDLADDHQFPNLSRVLDVAVGPEGYVYIVLWGDDTTIRKFNPEGVEVADWMSLQNTEGGPVMSVQCPTNIALDGAGNLYIREVRPDAGTPEIHAFGPTGVLLWSRDENAHDFSGDTEGRLYLLLSEPQRNRLRVLDANGDPLEDWSAGDLGLEDYRLTSIGVGPQGNIVVAGLRLPSPDQPEDGDRLMVSVVSPAGEALHQWAVTDRSPAAYISAVSVDKDGRIMVIDMAAQLVGVYTPEGELLHEF